MAPRPQDLPGVDPTKTFVVTRVQPNLREPILATATIDETNPDAIRRTTAQEAARQQRTNNPAWVIVIYGPTDGAFYTNDDRIWDSRTDL